MKLRPFLPGDAATVTRLLTDPIIAKTFILPEYPNPEAALPLFQRMLEISQNPNRYVRSICLGETMIGFINDTEIKENTIELGYVIDPAHHGKGYMTQPLQLAIQELFAQGYRSVITGAFSENVASIRVMEKCGMSRLSHTDTLEYRGNTHLCVYYSIENRSASC